MEQDQDTPNLFLVGAAKSGTTSLANYMSQHPEVFVSEPKEPNFFALPEGQPLECVGPYPSERLVEILLSHSITTRDEYHRIFRESGAATYRVDASVRYLYHPDAAQRIAETSPNAQVIAMLREPIDRLNSHYHMNLKFGVEPETLPRALELEDERVQQGWGWDWHYVRVGLYGEQLQRYFDRFAPEQIHVIFYDEFKADPQVTLARLYHRLGVNSEVFANTEQRSNVGQTPKYRWLRQLLWEDNLAKRVAQKLIPRAARSFVSEWVERRNRIAIPSVPTRVRQEVSPRFERDREHLETLLGRKLPW